MRGSSNICATPLLLINDAYARPVLCRSFSVRDRMLGDEQQQADRPHPHAGPALSPLCLSWRLSRHHASAHLSSFSQSIAPVCVIRIHQLGKMAAYYTGALELNTNQISGGLPSELGLFTAFSMIYLDGNALTSLPTQVRGKGWAVRLCVVRTGSGVPSRNRCYDARGAYRMAWHGRHSSAWHDMVWHGMIMG